MGVNHLRRDTSRPFGYVALAVTVSSAQACLIIIYGNKLVKTGEKLD